MFGLLKKVFGSAQDRTIAKYKKIVTTINEWDEEYKALSDQAIREKTEEFKQRFKKGETLDDLLPEAYALVKNVCRRMMGQDVHVSGYNQKWDMVPFDIQLVGAIALHQGAVAEMQTGEGKTLTAVLPLYLNSLSGDPVYLVTVNDYLAKRDCEWVGSILRWLGLVTAPLINATPIEERKTLYLSDVIYGTASEFGFDYLRDNSMASSVAQQTQRGYGFAIIDEADSILIDEARTPLIISGPSPESKQMYAELEEGVGKLVKEQNAFCNQLATAAFKVLSLKERGEEGVKLTPDEKEALKQLWLVSKGTPRHKLFKRVMEHPEYRRGIDEWDLYFHSDQNKQEKIEILAELYIIVDEKTQEYELSDKGIRFWEEKSGREDAQDDFVMLDISDAYITIDENTSLTNDEKIEEKLKVQKEDAERKERAHNLRQMLRAHLLMEKDVDYIVHDRKIVIIDEHTGRPQPGRRFSDGLHQAIEAKEGLEIQKETQTYATVTLQNFFRMFKKLAGMTGTANTEASEFKQIYKMDVLTIPTHRPCVRVDENDEIYMTEREKYAAIIKDITEKHRIGRPILVGTESVDVSEKLSRILKQHQLPHTILNAKNHEREAEIIASAGQKGAITIATNMAGRGTDIKLGTDVASIGGLYVLGTTRHQSRRIDRQLRGRSARLGDPGSSKFYISFEDSLLRLFASPRMSAMLQRFRPPEGEPISAKILNRSIEQAQKRVEQRNFMMRKHTLEYDDVMNKQREEIYSFRNHILRTPEIISFAEEIIEEAVFEGAEKCAEDGWDGEAFRLWLMSEFPISFDEGAFDNDSLSLEAHCEVSLIKILSKFREKVTHENTKLDPSQLPAGVIAPKHPAQEALRHIMLTKVDLDWKEHLLHMDHLRADVALRAVGQRDPLIEFKHEAFQMFDLVGKKIRAEIAKDLFRFEVVTPDFSTLEEFVATLRMEKNRSFLPEFDETQVLNQEGPSPTTIGSNLEKLEPITVGPKPGRNDDCPCGSGKKYKKCCGALLE